MHLHIFRPDVKVLQLEKALQTCIIHQPQARILDQSVSVIDALYEQRFSATL